MSVAAIEIIDNAGVEVVEISEEIAGVQVIETLVQGPAGAAGDKGDKGDTGAQGPPGIQGVQGIQGPPGIQGVQGNTGAAGANAYEIAVQDGFSGTVEEWLASLIGPTGPQGPKGDTGETGAAGPVGPTGPKGDTGAQGAKGDTGAQGLKGDTGAGVPAGGGYGQILTKGAGGDYDTSWETPNTFPSIIDDGGTVDIEADGFVVNSAEITFLRLPTSNPGYPNRLWNDGGTVRVGDGAPAGRIFVQDSAPDFGGSAGLWIDTSGGDITFWIEDGL